MKRIPAVAAVFLFLFAAGCANYRLGSMLPKDIRTVYVPTCRNQTPEPLIEQDVTRAILSQIQMDGALRGASESDADVVLEITLNRFWLDPVAYEAGSASTANQYRMTSGLPSSCIGVGPSVVVAAPSVTVVRLRVAGDMSSSKAIACGPSRRRLAGASSARSSCIGLREEPARAAKRIIRSTHRRPRRQGRPLRRAARAGVPVSVARATKPRAQTS
jgi:hypothetical protein